MADQPPVRDPDDRQRILDRISREQPEPAPLDYARPTPRPVLDESPMWTLIAAILFLYVGFYVAYQPLNNAVNMYNVSVTCFTWMSRIVGVGLLVVAALAFVRVPGVRALDFVLAVLAAAGCMSVGIIWVLNGDNEGYLIGLFGLVNAMAARSAWFAWKGRPAA